MFGWLKSKNQPKASPPSLHELVKQILASDEMSGSEHQKWILNSVKSTWSESALSEFLDLMGQVDSKCASSENPIEVLRLEIMDSVDSSCRNSAILAMNEDQLRAITSRGDSFTRENLLGVHLFSEFETYCLRLYAYSKFQDGNRNDWFQLYVEGSSEYGKHMANMVAASAGVYPGDPNTLALLHEPFEKAHHELRQKLLKSPLGASFSSQDA
jgi:hypothetical protein